MTVFGEPIATWLSIAAFVISLSALLLARRKQHADERATLARQLSEIKAQYADGLLVLGRIHSLLHEFDAIYRKLSGKAQTHATSELGPSLDLLDSLRSNWADLYNKIGSQDPLVTDPVRLSSIAVESRHLKDNLSELHGVLAEILGPTIKKLRFSTLQTKKSRKLLPLAKTSPKLRSPRQKRKQGIRHK